MKKLFEFICDLKGCKIAFVEYTSELKVPKKYGICGVVEKKVSKQVQIGYSYESTVNSRLERVGQDGNFVASGLSWGSWVVGCENKIIEYNGSYYLRAYAMRSNKKSEIIYYVNGIVASVDEIEKIAEYEKSKSYGSKKQAESGLLENQVKPMNIKFSNIIRLKVSKDEYVRQIALAV